MTPLDGLAVSAWLAELAELGCWWPVVKGLVWRPDDGVAAGPGGRGRGLGLG